MARKYGLLVLIGFLGAALLASEVQGPTSAVAAVGGRWAGWAADGWRWHELLTLVQNEKVQKELEIVDDQKTKLTELATEQRTAMRECLPSLQDLSREERMTKMQE